MTTYSALLAAAGKVPGLEPKEADEDYLKRLILAVSSIPVPAFERMPDDARTWFDSAADALSAGMRVPPPEGFDREEAMRPAAAAPPMAAGRIMRPSGSSYAPPVFTRPVAPPPPPQGPARSRAGEPVRDTIIRLMLAEPDLTAEGLRRRLAENHIQNVGDVASQRGFVATVLRVIRETGWKPA
jgi:hypothetical protein